MSDTTQPQNDQNLENPNDDLNQGQNPGNPNAGEGDKTEDDKKAEESEFAKKARTWQKENSQMKKQLAELQAKLESKDKPDPTLEDKIKNFEQEIENLRVDKKKTDIQKTALELGLNPNQKATFEKYFLGHILSSDDIQTALDEVKAENPYLFKEPEVNLSGKNLGGVSTKSGKLTKAEAQRILSSKNNAEVKKYTDLEIYQALNS